MNAASVKEVKKADQKEKFSRQDELNDMYSVLSTLQGRRFIWRYLGLCGVFRTSFTGNSQTFFNEGERNIGLKLMADINDADPDSYLKMIKENKNNE